MAYRNKRQSSGTQNKGVKAVIILLAVLVLAGGGIGYYVLNNIGKDANPSNPPGSTKTGSIQASNKPQPGKDKFYEGVYVDDISLGGLTMEQAKQQVAEKQQAVIDSIQLELTHAKGNLMLTSKDVTYTYDTDSVLDKAFQQGREGTADEQKKFIEQLAGSPVKLTTTLAIDPSAVEQKVRDYAVTLVVPAVNAAFKSFDPAKPVDQRFVFSADVPGAKADADALWASVKKAFADKTFGPLPVITVPVDAAVKLAELQANTKLIVSFPTTQKDHKQKDRFSNLTLACKAISGHVVMPGEVFSFNNTTGERTAAKGYKEAHVINGGIIDNGMAGGTCQVSGTLFNAVVRADLEIVQRTAHTLKSAYLALGQDATVDFGSKKDLKFKNNKSTPVYIIMYTATTNNKWTCNAEIYGMPLPAKETIGMYSEITEKVTAPLTTSYKSSDTVKPGKRETVKPHDGLRVSTYKLYMKGGKEVKRVLLYKDYYKPAGTIILYNPADPVPTPTPKATPTPVPTLITEPTPTPLPIPIPPTTPPAG